MRKKLPAISHSEGRGFGLRNLLFLEAEKKSTSRFARDDKTVLFPRSVKPVLLVEGITHECD